LVDLITLVVLDNVVEDVVEAFMGILVVRAAVDELLLAEGASLAGARALVGAVTDQVALPAGVDLGAVDQGVVAEEDRASGIITSWVLQAEGEAGVIAALVVPPVLGGKFDAFGHCSNVDDWCSDTGCSRNW